jgi:hypothetical protein
LVRRLLTSLGIFMGDLLNTAGDAMTFEPFLEKELPALLERVRCVDYRAEDLPRPLLERLETRFATVLQCYRAECPKHGSWGWKHPRSLYLLPLLKRQLGLFTFIHVVRDGRDMALSANQNQLLRYKAALLEAPPDDPALLSAAFWQRVNLDAMAWGRRSLGARYIVVRYEDLCDRPLEAIGRLRERLTELGHGPLVKDPRLFFCSLLPSRTRERWRSLSAVKARALEDAAGEALKAFNYEPAMP